jgi:hypothetical protein
MVYVFKTSVRNKKQVLQLSPLLNDLVQQSKWNFDLDDCDKILRIDSSEEILKPVIILMQNNGFDCTELPG